MKIRITIPQPKPALFGYGLLAIGYKFQTWPLALASTYRQLSAVIDILFLTHPPLAHPTIKHL